MIGLYPAHGNQATIGGGQTGRQFKPIHRVIPVGQLPVEQLHPRTKCPHPRQLDRFGLSVVDRVRPGLDDGFGLRRGDRGERFDLFDRLVRGIGRQRLGSGCNALRHALRRGLGRRTRSGDGGDRTSRCQGTHRSAFSAHHRTAVTPQHVTVAQAQRRTRLQWRPLVITTLVEQGEQLAQRRGIGLECAGFGLLEVTLHLLRSGSEQVHPFGTQGQRQTRKLVRQHPEATQRAHRDPSFAVDPHQVGRSACTLHHAVDFKHLDRLLRQRMTQRQGQAGCKDVAADCFDPLHVCLPWGYPVNGLRVVEFEGDQGVSATACCGSSSS